MGRNYSAYEESDCFAGTSDDIATNHTNPSLDSEETIYFGWAFYYKRKVK